MTDRIESPTQPAQIVTRKRRATLSGYEKTPITAIVMVSSQHAALERVIAAVSFSESVLVFCNTPALATHCAQFADKDITVVCDESQSLQDHWQHAIEMAKHDWILLLHDDEVLDYEAATTVQVLEWFDHTRAWRIARHLHVGKQEIRYGGWADTDHIRLFHRGHATLQIDTLMPRIYVAGAVHLLPGAVHRHALQNIADIIPAITKQPGLYGWTVGHHTASPFVLVVRGFAAFFSRYFIRFGWRDGYSGLILALTAVVTSTLISLPKNSATSE